MTNFHHQQTENVQPSAGNTNDNTNSQYKSPESRVRDCANDLMRQFPEFWTEMNNSRSDTSQKHLPGLDLTDCNGDGRSLRGLIEPPGSGSRDSDNDNSNNDSDRSNHGHGRDSSNSDSDHDGDGSHPRDSNNSDDDSYRDISSNPGSRQRDSHGRSHGRSHDWHNRHRDRNHSGSERDQDSPEGHPCDGDGPQPPEQTPTTPDCPDTPQAPPAPETPCNPDAPPVTAPPEVPSVPEAPPVTAPPEIPPSPPEAPPVTAPPETPPVTEAPTCDPDAPPGISGLEKSFNRTEFAAKLLLGKFEGADTDKNGKLSAHETREMLKELTPFGASAIRDRLLHHWSGIKKGAIDGHDGVSQADLQASITRQQQKAALRGFNQDEA